jgi:hypothetical protein
MIVMDIDEFRHSLAASAPPSGMSRLAQALWYDAKGDWTRAHEIVQAVKGKTGARVHAYLHRKEGDADNARYWHDRAGTKMPEISLDKEWHALVDELLRDESK